MLFFPCLMIYLYLCLEHNNGALILPAKVSIDGVLAWFKFVYSLAKTSVIPNKFATVLYLGFCVFQAILAVIMVCHWDNSDYLNLFKTCRCHFQPGPIVKGLPIPSLKGKQLDYKCNGVSSFYATLITSAILHRTGILPLAMIVDNFGPLLTVSILTGFAVTLITYIVGRLYKLEHRMSGYVIYDLFMGVILNPRIGPLDLKMWVEIRVV